jgi:hypothetical protein
MRIDESEAQSRNKHSPTNERREPEPNVTIERERQSTKHRRPSLLTDEGIWTDESNGHWANAASSSEYSSKPDSNVTVKRDSHCEKEPSPMHSTSAGQDLCAKLAAVPTSPSVHSSSVSRPDFFVAPHPGRIPARIQEIASRNIFVTEQVSIVSRRWRDRSLSAPHGRGTGDFHDISFPE